MFWDASLPRSLELTVGSIGKSLHTLTPYSFLVSIFSHKACCVAVVGEFNAIPGVKELLLLSKFRKLCCPFFPISQSISCIASRKAMISSVSKLHANFSFFMGCLMTLNFIVFWSIPIVLQGTNLSILFFLFQDHLHLLIPFFCILRTIISKSLHVHGVLCL